MKTFNVLFLCTGNSARSILAEALITTMSQGKLIGYSAGSHPKGIVHPIALELSIEMGYPKEKLRSKSWNEYSHPEAPKWISLLLFVITLKMKFVLSGQAILLLSTGACLTQHYLWGLMKNKRKYFVMFEMNYKKKFKCCLISFNTQNKKPSHCYEGF